ncbi:hypothetical protein KAV67_01315, partial [Candidatus Bipolaricaulota bacterium]|nr:hypothetical protein [Candidatus Bipolaricaulota bacterium]
MNTDYKLFASDADGTLLERNGVLVPSTRGFLAELSMEVFHSKYELGDPAMVAPEAFRQASQLLS